MLKAKIEIWRHMFLRLGILTSIRSPASIVLPFYDIARAIRGSGIGFIGGFQSPLERDFLDILLSAQPSVVVCPARSTTRMRIPAAWKPHSAEGRLTIVSPFPENERRPRRNLAEQRNRAVAEMSDAVLIGYATPGGAVDRLARELLTEGKPLFVISDPANSALVALGARPATGVTLPSELAALTRALTN